MITPTTITTEDQIYLVGNGTALNVDFRNIAHDTTIKSVVVELYVWRGNLNNPPVLASYRYPVEKVSISDDRITLNFADVVASYIIATRPSKFSACNITSYNIEIGRAHV